MTIDFEVIGNPMGKQRARTLRNGHSFTPSKTVNYETLVKLSCPRIDNQMDGPLSIEITAFYPIPKSFSKKKHTDAICGCIYPVVKPDADNVIKIICDALNGVAYHDDAQVVKVCAEKKYGEIPRVKITIQEMA